MENKTDRATELIEIEVTREMRAAGGRRLDDLLTEGSSLIGTPMDVVEDIYLAMERQRRGKLGGL